MPSITGLLTCSNVRFVMVSCWSFRHLITRSSHDWDLFLMLCQSMVTRVQRPGSWPSLRRL